MKNTNTFERQQVTVDVLIFTIEEGELKVLLVRRAVEPFSGMWAIPGGFIQKGESLEGAAKRVLIDKTGVGNVYLEQLYTFGDPKRDPRTRVITVSYMALISYQELKKPVSKFVSDSAWFSVKKLPVLAFDHKKIFNYALNRLRNKAEYSNIVYGLLPGKFRLSELQSVTETVLDKPIDKRNFRRRMLTLGILAPTGKKEMDGAHRPAMLYKFKNREVVFFD